MTDHEKSFETATPKTSTDENYEDYEINIINPSTEETLPVPETEKTDNVDDLTEIINYLTPDRWMIGLPETENLPPMLYFYKENDIVLAYPLYQENLAKLAPTLDNMYDKPEKKDYSITGFTKWLKKHKFVAGILILLLILIGYAALNSALTTTI